MNMECPNFTVNYETENATYGGEVGTVGLFIYFRPILEDLLKFLKSDIADGEAFVYDYFVFHTSAKLKGIFLRLGYSFMYFVLLCVLTLATLITVPFSFCYCKFGTINAVKSQCWFCMESVLLVVWIIFLLLGALVHVGVARQVQEVLSQYPPLIRNMIGNLDSELRNFDKKHSELQKFLNDIDSDMQRDAMLLPGNLASAIGETPEVKYALSSIKRSIDLLDKKARLESKSDIEKFKSYTCNLLETQNLNYLNPATNLNYSQELASDFFVVHRLPQSLKDLYDDFNLTRVVELKFRDTYVNRLLNLKTPHPNLKESKDLVERLWRKERILDGIRNATVKFDKFVSSMAFLKSGNFPEINGLHFLAMVPSLYSFGFTLLVLFGCLQALKKLRRCTNKSTFSSGGGVVFFYNLAITYSASLLWILFLSTAFVEFFFWPIAIACNTFEDGTIFTRYLDNSTVWNGSWYKYIWGLNNTSMNTTDLLDKCEANLTLATILKLDEISLQEFYNSSIHINTSRFESSVRVALEAVKIPSDEDLRNAMKNIQHANDQLLLNKPNDSQICLKLKYATSHGEISSVLGNEFNVLELKWSLNEAKKLIAKVLLINKYLKESFISAKDIKTNRTIAKLMHDISCKLVEKKEFVKFNVENNLGRCHVLPYTLKHLKALTCNHFLHVIMALNVSLSIISFSMLLCFIWTYRLSKYIKGTIEFFHSLKITDHRYSSNTSKLIALRKVPLPAARDIDFE